MEVINFEFAQYKLLRIGELKAVIAHKDYELEQTSTCIKKFESMVARFIKYNSN